MSAGTNRRSVAFSGGGTGGHVFPGLAVAEELRRRGWRAAWIGRGRSLEQRLVENAGLEFRALPSLPFVDRGAVERAVALSVLGASTLRAAVLLRRLRAAVVLATGGYACAPAALGARLSGAALYLLEPNAAPGAANRLLSRFATEAGVAFDSAAERLACEARLVGAPVRRAFRQVGEPKLASGRTRILVLGGSQGSDALNRRLPELFARVARSVQGSRSGAALPGGEVGRAPGGASTAIEVTHQSGPASVGATRERYLRLDAPGLQATVEGFIEDTAGAMAAHDLIVSRAGAVTVAEAAAAGRPAVYVPLPLAAGHQRANAAAMADAGAAILVEQDDLEQGETVERCAVLIADHARLAAMARAARAHGRGDAAQVVAGRICALAGAQGTVAGSGAGRPR